MKAKTIFVLAVGLLALIIFAVFTFGTEKSRDTSHELRMTDEQIIDLNKQALSSQEFEIWKAAWDLKYKSDAWKQENAEEMNNIKARNEEQKQAHEKMRKQNPKAYREKYAPYFGQ